VCNAATNAAAAVYEEEHYSKHGFVLEMLASSGLSKHAETKACTTLLCRLMRRGLRKHRSAKEHMDKTGRSTLCPCLGT